MATQVTLRATQDAHVAQTTPDRNFGERPALALKNDAPLKRTFIGFSLKAIPPDATIHSATLRLRLRDAWAGTHDITAQRVNLKWSERRVTWNNQPTVTGATAAVTVTGGADDDLVTIDVATLVAAAVERNAAWHGIRLVIDGTGNFLLHSSEVSSRLLRPVLRVEYSVAPDAPTRLRPRGGNAVNAAEPKLAWDVEDQSELRVQVNETDDFTAPSYDSGFEVSEEPGWDLALAASPDFTALADGDERFWRVQVKDSDGNESPWSLSARFERRTYGTFAIDSPASDGDAVEDSTPTIITSLTGRTQTRIGWGVSAQADESPIVRGVEDPGRYFTGLATDDPSFELTRGIVTDPSLTYRLTVRVWDEYDRGTAVGEASFVQATREFIYDPTAGITAVSALAATQPDISPMVRLTWTRASAPDSYDVRMDGVLLEQQIDPADVFVSGTSYSYDTWAAKPGDLHTFVVVANEGAQDSISNPSVSITPTCKGLWLVAPADDLVVLLHTGGPVPLALGETGTTFDLLNRKSVVRITDSLRGWEGEVGGRLKDSDHGTVTEERTALLSLKELDPSSEIRVIFPNTSIPVLLGEMSLPAHALPDEEYEVSVQVWQSGEFEVS